MAKVKDSCSNVPHFGVYHPHITASIHPSSIRQCQRKPLLYPVPFRCFGIRIPLLQSVPYPHITVPTHPLSTLTSECALSTHHCTNPSVTHPSVPLLQSVHYPHITVPTLPSPTLTSECALSTFHRTHPSIIHPYFRVCLIHTSLYPPIHYPPYFRVCLIHTSLYPPIYYPPYFRVCLIHTSLYPPIHYPPLLQSVPYPHIAVPTHPSSTLTSECALPTHHCTHPSIIHPYFRVCLTHTLLYPSSHHPPLLQSVP